MKCYQPPSLETRPMDAAEKGPASLLSALVKVWRVVISTLFIDKLYICEGTINAN